MSKNILVIGEHQDGKIKKSILGILTKAKEIGSDVSVVLLGKDLTDNKEMLGKFGISKVYLYKNESLENYHPEIYKKLLLDLINEIKPDCVFALTSSQGKDLMPRLGAKLKAGLANDCIDIRLENEGLIFKRPIYAGKAFVDIIIKSELTLAAFRPNVLESKEQEQASEIEVINKEVNVDMENLSHKLIEVVQSESSKPDLTEAEIIVSGGRGIKDKEGLKLIEQVAKALGPKTVVGASRAIVDADVAEHSMQVGQTGKVVNPTLYMAFGISGATQHLAGMKTSKCIVAINKDPEASIFQIADFGIVGDLFKIIPVLKEALEKLKE